MDVSWPNILRIISKLDEKLSFRISVLEQLALADDDMRRAEAETTEGRRGDPDTVSTEADCRLCPTISRDGRLEARVSSMHRTMSEMEVTITHLQRQLAADENRFEACDWDFQALSESINDLFFAHHHKADTREKQLAIIGHRLSDVCKQQDKLQMQVDEMTSQLDSGFFDQLPDAVAATEILTHGLQRLAGRMEHLETDKLGSQIAGVQVAEVLQQVAALEDEVRGMHKISEEDSFAVTQQPNEASGKLAEHMDALEYKTSAMTRVMRLLAKQTCILNVANIAHGRTHALAKDATAELSEIVKGFDELRSSGSSLQFEGIDHDGRTAEDAPMSQPTFYETSIANLGDSKMKQQVFFDAQRSLKGRVRRLVKQFGGACMEEEAAETCCDSHRSALSVVTGIDESNGAISFRSDANTSGHP